MNKHLLPYLALFVASIIWGITGPVIKNTLQFVEPFTLLTWRFIFAVSISLPFFLFYLKKNPLKLSHLPKLLVIAVLGNILPLTFVFQGFKYTSSIEGTIIGSLSPLLVAIAASFYLKEKLSRKELVGISLAIAGTVSIAVEPLFQMGLSGESHLLGNFLIFLNIISWMFCVMLIKHWRSDEIKPFHITGLSFILSLLVFFPLSFIESKGLPKIDLSNPQILGGLLYLSVFASLTAYTLYYIGLSKVHAAKADIFNYLQPIWAIPIAVFWLHEKITTFILIGMFLIVVGVVTAEYHARKRRKLAS